MMVTGTVHSYRVKRGDTLGLVASWFGLDAAALAAENGLRPNATLQPGDVLRVDNRHIAPPFAAEPGLVINIPQRMLFFADDEALVAAYPVSVGRSDWPTPLGTFEIATKEVDPTWDVPVSIQREMEQAGRSILKTVPPGSENPLGDRWLGLRNSTTGIHSTNAPSSIYRFATHGCIRLNPDHARALFDLVAVGDRVRIVYEPVLVGVDEGGRAWLEVHPDIYGRGGDSFSLAVALLGQSGVFVDPVAVRRCVSVSRGRPCAL